MMTARRCQVADPREPFVGRGVELELLGAELDLARAGNSRLVWIEAPAGMGKTTLVRRFLNDAETPVVLWAAAEETQVTQDWRVLDRLLAGVPGEMRSPAERLRARLSPDARPAVVRTELVEVLRGLEGAPTVVVLDDAACIDRASAETLRIAFRQLESDPLLVVATARPGADSDWEHLIATDDRARRVPLSGLSAEDVRRLAAAKGKPIEPLAARRVQRHTAGNPLYACALIEELDQAILARGRGPLPAPRSLTLAVGRRLSACSPPAQALVQAVAVLGSPASLDSARLLAGLEDPWPALEEAATKGLLVEVAGSSYAEVAFVRPLAAVAVYHQLSRGCRSHLHAQAMALTAGEARLRHQVEAARSVHSQAEAVAGQLEAQADQEMANGAPRPAALHMDQAASLTSAGWLRSRRLLRAAEALLASGDVAAAAARWQEVEPGSGPRESLLAGQLTFLGGRASAAEQCLETAWGQSRQIGEPALAARAASTRAIVAVTRGHADVAAYWATKVEPAPGGGGAHTAWLPVWDGDGGADQRGPGRSHGDGARSRVDPGSGPPADVDRRPGRCGG